MAQENEKLTLFEEEILRRANAEKDEILRAVEEEKRAELAKEENRLLEEHYRKIQAQVAEIKTNSIKEISRETRAMKRKLYQQREQYLVEMLAKARVELAAFVKSDEYEAFLMKRVSELAKEYPLEGSVLRVRTEDLRYADKIREIYGACTVEADDASIAVGGVILLNVQRGVEVDLSLDAALAEQRGWFYSHSNFNFEETGETA